MEKQGTITNVEYSAHSSNLSDKVSEFYVTIRLHDITTIEEYNILLNKMEDASIVKINIPETKP